MQIHDVVSARPQQGCEPVSVAVLGTGAIGQDLISKVHRSPWLTVGLAVGRRPESAGLQHARELGYATSARGIDAVLEDPDAYAVVFDATSAMAHQEHWRRLQRFDALVVDLTPSRVGEMVVPDVTGIGAPTGRNVNLISCGGQASVPLVHALSRAFDVEYVEVVSTVASTIAGRATRLNLDEYVATTQHALTTFSGVADAKAILNISPAVPPATFRTAVNALIPGADEAHVAAVARDVAQRMRTFAPGYAVTACSAHRGQVTVALEVTAHSDVLPAYAGNLDVINSAAIMVAEQHAARLHVDVAVGAAQ